MDRRTVFKMLKFRTLKVNVFFHVHVLSRPLCFNAILDNFTTRGTFWDFLFASLEDEILEKNLRESVLEDKHLLLDGRIHSSKSWP